MTLELLDRIVIAYLVLPLVIFLAGWLRVWAAVPLLLCVAYALRPLLAALSAAAKFPITPLQLTVAVAAGCGWTVFGGTGHFLYANFDWHLRDAVLHDLVASPWPVGYGLLDGKESLLRAPVAFYLPAAIIGKWAGLLAAHYAMAVWTAIGASLFLLQVLSLVPSRLSVALPVVAVIVLFSGFDILGSLLNVPRFVFLWDSARHLEWWAGSYQYSSMTTQMFWVPNHALGGWLLIGMLFRDRLGRGPCAVSILPVLVVAIALWSPLAAIGLVPFVIWKVIASATRDGYASVLDPRVWAPALPVGLVVAAYLTLDAGAIHRSLEIGASGLAFDDLAMDFLRLAQFFLLEAGILGIAILAIRRSSQTVLALIVLALLPMVNFGPGNDLVMRSSIPALTVLAIAASLALFGDAPSNATRKKKIMLGCLLAIGAVTPFTEFARAVELHAWPINLQATVIGAACGKYPPHYIAHLSGEAVTEILKEPHRLALGSLGPAACDNPSLGLYMKQVRW
jgi:hypothetical protein